MSDPGFRGRSPSIFPCGKADSGHIGALVDEYVSSRQKRPRPSTAGAVTRPPTPVPRTEPENGPDATGTGAKVITERYSTATAGRHQPAEPRNPGSTRRTATGPRAGRRRRRPPPPRADRLLHPTGTRTKTCAAGDQRPRATYRGGQVSGDATQHSLHTEARSEPSANTGHDGPHASARTRRTEPNKAQPPAEPPRRTADATAPRPNGDSSEAPSPEATDTGFPEDHGAPPDPTSTASAAHAPTTTRSAGCQAATTMRERNPRGISAAQEHTGDETYRARKQRHAHRRTTPPPRQSRTRIRSGDTRVETPAEHLNRHSENRH